MSDPVETLLLAIKDPETGDGFARERIQGQSVSEGVVTLVLSPGGDHHAIKTAIEEAASGIQAIDRVRVIFEASRSGTRSTETREKPAGQSKSDMPASPARFVIAVGSGKGGVGKSTVAANLAVACARAGLATGFMDADVYGPSGPRLFGLEQAPGLQKSDQGIEPLEAHGVKMVSMGFLVGARDPVVWRGPMVTGAIRQFLGEVNWGDLDVLIIDMPPGTGDVQLALAQGTPVSGAVIVSTPQDLALDDARKAMALFDRVEIPVLGIIENMSLFLCPHCGEPSEIFGRGGAREEAGTLGIPFLGEIPLHIDLRRASDEGRLASDPNDPVVKAFDRIVHHMMDEAASAQRPAPEIVFED